MLNISIIRDGYTVLDKNITSKDIAKATCFVVIFCLLFCGDYDSLNLREHIKDLKWLLR